MLKQTSKQIEKESVVLKAENSRHKKNNPLVAALFLFMNLLFLYVGLRPFNFISPNQVREAKGGLQFGPRGIGFSEQLVRRPGATGITLEIGLKFHSLPYHSVPRVLSLVDENGTEMLYVGQWKGSLLVRAKTHPEQRTGTVEASTGYRFSVGQEVVFRMTSGPGSTRFFVDGELVRESEKLTGLNRVLREGVYLVVANGPTGTNPWKGVIQSISLYDSEVVSFEATDSESSPVVHYSLTQKNGSVPDLAGSENPLLVPESFRGLKKEFLIPVRALSWSRSLALDMVVNLLGFIPFGVFAFLFFRQFGGSFRAILLGIVSGIAVSLTIEYLQMYLPGRTSQMTDLILNSGGTVIGVIGVWGVIVVRKFRF